jgi:endonuclease/exonuclease/phosphatase family metal-dependent hydrolase
MIKLITLNVEGSRHWPQILPFLERERPDVLCLQELFERDLAMLKKLFNYEAVFLPMYRDRYQEEVVETLGIALLVKNQFRNTHSDYYHKGIAEIQTHDRTSVESKMKTTYYGLVWGDVEINGKGFTIAATHFTWTPDGTPNEYQDKDAGSLFKILETIPSVVLCGDFNVPRGNNRIYHRLVERYKDNIPSAFATTMDVERHKVRSNPVEREKLKRFVVDFIFSTPEYQVTNVRQQFGVSDHTAIIAEVNRNR